MQLFQHDSKTALLTYCNTKLKSFQRPRKYAVVEEHDFFLEKQYNKHNKSSGIIQKVKRSV